MTDLSRAPWRKARRSQHNGGCVEVANLGDAMAVRDCKRPEAGAHVVGRTAFAAFLADAKAGRFDLGPGTTR